MGNNNGHRSLKNHCVSHRAIGRRSREAVSDVLKFSLDVCRVVLHRDCTSKASVENKMTHSLHVCSGSSGVEGGIGEVKVGGFREIPAFGGGLPDRVGKH